MLEMYRKMHSDGYEAQTDEGKQFIEREDAFPGNELPHHVGLIKSLINQHHARTILDYGSGKGKQYGDVEVKTGDGQVFPNIKSFWAVDSITCFDPGVEEFSKLPTGQFDGVVSTDVLEHLPEQDLSWIIGEMFHYASKFIFASIACYEAMARMPDGQNAHCTVREPKWWYDFFGRIGQKYPNVDFMLHMTFPEKQPDGSTALRAGVARR